MIEMGVGLDAGEWAEVQRHGCGRRKDARRKVVLEVGRGWATPSPLLRQHVLPIGYLGTLSGPRGAAWLNTARSPTVPPNGWNLSANGQDTVHSSCSVGNTSPCAHHEPLFRLADSSFTPIHAPATFPIFKHITRIMRDKVCQSWSKP